MLKFAIIFMMAVFQGCFSLTLEEACRLAWEHSPQLQAARADIEMRLGAQMQSGAYPNPFFSYSVENVFGNRHWKGWDGAESRYEFTQPIILGSKREHRMRAAAFQHQAAISEYRAFEIAHYNQLKKAFLEVAAQQELLRLAEEQLCVSGEILRATQEKVEAGKVSAIHHNKAMLERANSGLYLENARTELASSMAALALFWGSPCPDFEQADYPFFQVQPPGCPGTIEDHPALERARFLYSAASERVEQEKAERIPDVAVTVGVKTERECRERGMIIGASIPLPFFDTNCGNIRVAEAELCRYEALVQDVEAQLKSRLAMKQREALRAYEEALKIQTHILSLAQESFQFVKQGYEEGKYEYLDLLEAKKALFEVKERHIQALLQFFKRNTDREYLTL